MDSAPIVLEFEGSKAYLVYRLPSSRRKVLIHIKWDGMDKSVNQVRVYLQQCIKGEFHNVRACHFCWEDSQESLNAMLIKRNETRRFYLSGLREDCKNPLYCFLVKYQVDNIEQSFSQYFTICGRGTNENAMERVLKAMKRYPQDSALVQAFNLFQSVYDQIRINSSGNRVKNGTNKRKAVEKITKVSSDKKAKTESVLSVSAPMNQDAHLIQNSCVSFHLPSAVPINPFDPIFPFDLSGQLSMPSCPYYALPIQPESASESISADLLNGLTMHRSFFSEDKKPDVHTVVENKAIVKDDILDFEQFFLDHDDTLDFIMSNPVSTESEDINQDMHTCSTLELSNLDFISTDPEISTSCFFINA
jgi:hypothetical protein